MATNPSDLPSKVDEILSICPKFRILLAGKSGVGKSLLVSSVFNISEKETDVQSHQAGTADIEREYNYNSNLRLILHDSRGLEPGDTETLDIVTKFLQEKCDPSNELQDRLHAIWLCLESPLPGERLLEHGNEQILRIITEDQNLHVALVVVFTKFDWLITNFDEEDNKEDAIQKATKYLVEERIPEITQKFPGIKLQYAKVFSDDDDTDANEESGNISLDRGSLLELTELTLDAIKQEFEGDLWLLWITAQQINANQKVIGSIDQGLKKYWIDLGRNAIFDHQPLINCLARIHDDIIHVWFDNPNEALLTTGRNFYSEMLRLLGDFLPPPNEAGSPLSPVANVAQIASLVGGTPLFISATVVLALGKAYEKYKNNPTTTLCLAAYIADLIVVLRELFRTTRETRTPRAISEQLALDELRAYEMSTKKGLHERVKGIAKRGLPKKPELELEKLIKEEIGCP